MITLNDVLVIVPELYLTAAACLVLLFDVFIRDDQRDLTHWMAIVVTLLRVSSAMSSTSLRKSCTACHTLRGSFPNPNRTQIGLNKSLPQQVSIGAAGTAELRFEGRAYHRLRAQLGGTFQASRDQGGMRAAPAVRRQRPRPAHPTAVAFDEEQAGGHGPIAVVSEIVAETRRAHRRGDPREPVARFGKDFAEHSSEGVGLAFADASDIQIRFRDDQRARAPQEKRVTMMQLEAAFGEPASDRFRLRTRADVEAEPFDFHGAEEIDDLINHFLAGRLFDPQSVNAISPQGRAVRRDRDHGAAHPE